VKSRGGAQTVAHVKKVQEQQLLGHHQLEMTAQPELAVVQKEQRKTERTSEVCLVVVRLIPQGELNSFLF